MNFGAFPKKVLAMPMPTHSLLRANAASSTLSLWGGLAARFSIKPRRSSSWAAVLAIPMLCITGLAQAQNADILLNQTDSPDPGPAMGVFTYTYTVSNNSATNTATNVVLNVVPPTPAAGGGAAQFVSFSQITGSGATCTPDPMPAPNGPLGANINCTIGNLAPNASVAFQLQMRLPSGVVYSSHPTVTSSNDPDTGNNGQPETTTVQMAADMQASAVARNAANTADITNVLAGELFSYRVTASNNGPDPLPNNGKVRVVFTVPAGAEAMSAPTGSTCTASPAGAYPRPAGTVFTCLETRAGGLASGASGSTITVPMRATTGSPGGGSNLTASFAASGLQANDAPMPDGNTANNTATVDLTAGEGTDVGIVKTRAPAGTITAGNTVTFTLTPSYVAGLPPTGTITVTDNVPAAFTGAVVSNANGWDCSATSGSNISCTLPASGLSATPGDWPAITLTATATGNSSVNNTGSITVTGGHPDSNSANNNSTVSVPVSNVADLRTAKSAQYNPVMVNQAFNYYVRVRNFGPLAIPAGDTVTVRDTPAAGITLFPGETGTSVAVAGGTCARSDSNNFPLVGNGALELICTRATAFPVGSGQNDGWLITVPAVATATGTFANNACVALTSSVLNNPNSHMSGGSSIPNDCDGVNVSATEGGPGQGADLEVVSKVGSPKPVQAGEELTYTIQVRNNGPQAATNVSLTDTLGSLLQAGGLVSASATGGAVCTPAGPANGPSQTVNCTWATLPVSQLQTVTIRVRPVIATTGNRVNEATIHSPDIGDPNQGNNSKTDTTQVTAIAVITIDKTATPATPVQAGEPVTYSAAITNAGPSTASGVTLVDSLPANAVFIRMVTPLPTGTTCNPPAAGAAGGTISCNLDTIAAGNTKTVSYLVRPAPAPGNNYTNYTMVNVARGNTTTLTTGGVAHPEVTDTTTTTVVKPVLDVLINKEDNTDPVLLGDTVVYEVRVENNGPAPYASSAVMVDTFPNPPRAGATIPTRTALFSYRGNLQVRVGAGPFSATLPAGMICNQPAIEATEGTLRCEWPGLETGIPVTFRYEMRAESITGSDPDSGYGTNGATISVAEEETDMTNNVTDEDTTARRNTTAPGSPVDLELRKTTSTDRALPGTEFDYTLEVINHHATQAVVPADGARVTDTLPAGLTFVSASGPVGTCSNTGSTVTCTAPNLAAGATTAFTLRVRVDSPYTGPGTVTNTACVDMPFDPVPGNNCSNVPKTVGNPPLSSIPTLSEWALIALSMLLAAFALRRMPLQPGRRM